MNPVTSPHPSTDWYHQQRRIQNAHLPNYALNLPARIGRLLPARGYPRCERCARPGWLIRTPHHTPLKPDPTRVEISCFPLCHRCWLALVTPEDRMPYYRARYQQWQQEAGSDDYDHDGWERVEMSVLEGL